MICILRLKHRRSYFYMDYELRTLEICPDWLCIDRGVNRLRKKLVRGEGRVKYSKGKRCFAEIKGERKEFCSVVQLCKQLGISEPAVRSALKRGEKETKYYGFVIGFLEGEVDEAS